MASPYATAGPVQTQAVWHPEIRSVTPATSNANRTVSVMSNGGAGPAMAATTTTTTTSATATAPSTTAAPPTAPTGTTAPAATVAAQNKMMGTTVTTNPAAANRYPSAPRLGALDGYNSSSNNNNSNNNNHARSLTPNRLVGVYNQQHQNHHHQQQQGLHLPMPNASPTSSGPTSTGLIRLSLKKPMGIVFEPMYDPNQPSAQRGVRICDLPRTGAAALSRKLQVGDELLQINDKTVSRLTFDEIMDYIIDADPEAVNLLFRRPRKETLQQRQGVQQKLNAAANKDNPSKIKWQMDEATNDGDDTKDGTAADDDDDDDDDNTNNNNNKKKKTNSNKKQRSSKRSKKGSNSDDDDDDQEEEEEEETLQSSVAGDESFSQQQGNPDNINGPNTNKGNNKKRRTTNKKGRTLGANRTKKRSSRSHPYESESFLDLLIDTICTNSNVCRDSFSNRPVDEYLSDDESFASAQDEDTYVTYEESLDDKKPNNKKKKHNSDNAAATPGGPATGSYDDDEEEAPDDDHQLETTQRSKRKDKDRFEKGDRKNNKKQGHHINQEPGDSLKRPNDDKTPTHLPHQSQSQQQSQTTPLGLSPSSPSPTTPRQQQQPQQQPSNPPLNTIPASPATENAADLAEDETNPNAPIREVEYDERIDHGADVSVMESLGGPSLLIEKQRAAQQANAQHAATPPQTAPVPPEILQEYGLEYPTEFGKSRTETIQADPLRFYTYVVKSLLEQHEPEKVRLLDKLLAKYKGREDHLVQKLSVRYNRANSNAGEAPVETDNAVAFSEAVKKTKSSPSAAAAVNTARERAALQDVADAAQHLDSHMIDGGGFIASWPEKEEKEPDVEDHQYHRHGGTSNHHTHPRTNDTTGGGGAGHEVPMNGEPQPVGLDGSGVGQAAPEEGSDSASEYSHDSVDGTSPAVIAQVSELLNYVYGKTSVPGQIDRVSTIMRAYEGREAVLLELLETKALIKANKEKENADELPAFLRNSQVKHVAGASGGEDDDEVPMDDAEEGVHHHHHHGSEKSLTPMSSAQVPMITDDISSMSGVSSPAATEREHSSFHMPTTLEEEEEPFFATPTSARNKKDSSSTMSPDKFSSLTPSKNVVNNKTLPPITPTPDKKKKKGIFGGLFSGKKKEKVGAGSSASGGLAGTGAGVGGGARSGSRQKGKKGSRDGSI